LAFLPLVMEHYDLVIPRTRRDRSPVRRLLALLTSDIGRQTLQRLGFGPATSPFQESV
jgi:molybdate-binding protein